MQMWARRAVDDILAMLAGKGVPFKNTERVVTIILITKWSGMGTAEVAIKYVREAVSAAGITCLQVHFYAA